MPDQPVEDTKTEDPWIECPVCHGAKGEYVTDTYRYQHTDAGPTINMETREWEPCPYCDGEGKILDPKFADANAASDRSVKRELLIFLLIFIGVVALVTKLFGWW